MRKPDSSISPDVAAWVKELAKIQTWLRTEGGLLPPLISSNMLRLGKPHNRSGKPLPIDASDCTVGPNGAER